METFDYSTYVNEVWVSVVLSFEVRVSTSVHMSFEAQA